MKGQSDRVSDLSLERYVLGELPPAKLRELRRLLETDPVLAARLAAIEASNREILDRYPAEGMAARLEQRLAAEAGAESVEAMPERPRFRPSLAFSLGIAAVLLVGLFALMPDKILSPLLGGPAHELTRIKGAPSRLIIMRKTDGARERLSENALAAKGDLLQIEYATALGGYGTIFSLDGRGNLTFHLPPGGGSSASPVQAAPPLETGRNVALRAAYELDDAPSFERFFFVLSPRPFALSLVRDAAEALIRSKGAREGGLVLPAPLSWSSVLLRKKE